jgi:hypothetical protein
MFEAQGEGWRKKMCACVCVWGGGPEMNRISLVLFDTNNRIFGSYLVLPGRLAGRHRPAAAPAGCAGLQLQPGCPGERGHCAGVYRPLGRIAAHTPPRCARAAMRQTFAA